MNLHHKSQLVKHSLILANRISLESSNHKEHNVAQFDHSLERATTGPFPGNSVTEQEVVDDALGMCHTWSLEWGSSKKKNGGWGSETVFQKVPDMSPPSCVRTWLPAMSDDEARPAHLIVVIVVIVEILVGI